MNDGNLGEKTMGKLLMGIGISVLQNEIKKYYGFNFSQVTLIPQGTVGENYTVTTEDDKFYFLKIYQGSKFTFDNPEIEKSLYLTSQLYSLGLENISYPYKTKDGRLSLEIGDCIIVVSRYIFGHNPQKYSSEVITACAKFVAKLHSLDFEGANIARETYTTEYANKLRVQLAQLNVINEPTQQIRLLRDFINPYHDLLMNYLEKYNEYAQRIGHSSTKVVVTHGDLICDNLLLDNQDELFVIDWDMAKLSFPERDLWFFVGEFGELFFRTYAEENPDYVLDAKFLKFFMYKRYLEDIVCWIDEIMDGSADLQQTEGNLEGIEVCCLEPLKTIDTRLERIQNFFS